MVGEAIVGLGAIKTAFDIAKGLKDIDNATSRNAAIIELQEKLLSAQAAQSTLVERIGALEKEVARFETWDTEKQQYELKVVGSGGFAYMLKPEARGSTPPHWLCPTCYEQRKKSYFQRSAMSKPIYICQSCKANFLSHSEPSW